MNSTDLTYKDIEVFKNHDESYKTSPKSLNNDYINVDNVISISKYYDFFDFKFNKLSNEFNLINPKEIYDFILLHDDLFDYLDQIKLFLQKYFHDNDYCLEFSFDPEFKSLNQLVVYINSNDASFEEDWLLLKKVNHDIYNLSKFSTKIKHLISVDLW